MYFVHDSSIIISMNNFNGLDLKSQFTVNFTEQFLH